MLRNPVEMARSLHNQLVFSLREDLEDFEAAWALQDARRRGESLPRHCREPSHLQYREVCSFDDQLERVFKHVSRDQVKVVLLEEMVAAPRATYLSVLEFLTLPDDGRTDFPRTNGGSVYGSRLIVDALNHLPRGIDPLLCCAKRVANRAGLRPLRLLKRIHAKQQPRKPLRPAFRDHLAEAFARDIRQTEQLLGHALDVWRDRLKAA